jgi:sec-independent protein translocase protein TatB
MFEIGFSEIVVIVVVALIVIGPEKLPKLARTYGLLYGRVQRYVSGIQQDMEREVALDQMKKATADAQQKLMEFKAQMLTVEGEAEVISELPLPETIEATEVVEITQK